MDRYLQRYFLDVPEEPVERMVREFLEQNHFKPSEWKGEPCWEVILPGVILALLFIVFVLPKII